MEASTAENEAGMLSYNGELATWNRPRTIEELRAFITSHQDRLPDSVEVE